MLDGLTDAGPALQKGLVWRSDRQLPVGGWVSVPTWMPASTSMFLRTVEMGCVPRSWPAVTYWIFIVWLLWLSMSSPQLTAPVLSTLTFIFGFNHSQYWSKSWLIPSAPGPLTWTPNLVLLVTLVVALVELV